MYTDESMAFERELLLDYVRFESTKHHLDNRPLDDASQRTPFSFTRIF